MPLPDYQPIAPRPSIREEVYSQLLTWIMEGVVLPGEKLVDTELCKHLGVSRTPVREAIKRLEDRGLVESQANRWTRVAEVPKDEPRMIYPIIWTLESLALAQAMPKMTGGDLSLMTRANEQLKDALLANDPVRATRVDARFHDVFIQRSENPHLIQILQDLKVKYRRLEILFFKGYTHITTSVKEHHDLIDALKQNDLNRAQSHLRLNWENSLNKHETIVHE